MFKEFIKTFLIVSTIGHAIGFAMLWLVIRIVSLLYSQDMIPFSELFTVIDSGTLFTVASLVTMTSFFVTKGIVNEKREMRLSPSWIKADETGRLIVDTEHPKWNEYVSDYTEWQNKNFTIRDGKLKRIGMEKQPDAKDYWK